VKYSIAVAWVSNSCYQLCTCKLIMVLVCYKDVDEDSFTYCNLLISLYLLCVSFNTKVFYCIIYAVQPGFSDISLYNMSSVVSDVL